MTRNPQELGLDLETVSPVITDAADACLLTCSRYAGDFASLRELDEVAYLRFASVYRAFGSADDFEREIQMLREERETRIPRHPADTHGEVPPPLSEMGPGRPGQAMGKRPAHKRNHAEQSKDSTISTDQQHG